jgi:hypothetical protein
MTFSIVARSAEGTALGVAVASKFLAVGAAVPAGIENLEERLVPGHIDPLVLEMLRNAGTHDAS